MKSYNPSGVFSANVGSFVFFELSKEEAVVIDVTSRPSACGAILKKHGYRTLHLIYTHPHADHVGGYADFFAGKYGKVINAFIVTDAALKQCNTSNAIQAEKRWNKVTAAAKSAGIPMKILTNGMSFSIGALSFKAFTSPKRKGVEDCNNYSAILHITDEYGYTYLYCGDIEAQTQHWCMEQELPIRSNVVLIPHHQHAYTAEKATNWKYRQDFAKYVFDGMSPKIALSNGLDPYGTQDGGGLLAKAKIKKWYEDAGADFYAIREKDVDITTSPDGMTVRNKTYLRKKEKAMAKSTATVAVAGTLPRILKGSKGKAVKIWQYFLTLEGYKLSADGSFGPNTDRQTKDYQKEHGLSSDGVVGTKTWSKAMECLGK